MSGLSWWHPQVLALLQAAHEQPEDDGPRLVLSDWLEEAGDGFRAEFIRLQCALALVSPMPDEAERSAARARVAELLARCGGAWLGPLWRHGGTWHRGLLSVDLDRLRIPEGLEEMRPWIDSAHFEVPGREALRWALALIPGLNHVTLALRRPFPADVLLDLLGESSASTCLRTFTFRWAPGMGVRTEGGPVVNLSEEFFARLVALPPFRCLTHLGPSFAFTDGQSEALRAAGVQPALAHRPDWPHAPAPVAVRRGPCP